MTKLDRIKIDPNKMNGQPIIRDLRLTVRRVLQIMATYPNRAEMRIDYPDLEDEDIRQALIFASINMPDQISPLSYEVAA